MNSKYDHYKVLPMTGFKPRTSVSGSNRSAHCAITRYPYITIFYPANTYLLRQSVLNLLSSNHISSRTRRPYIAIFYQLVLPACLPAYLPTYLPTYLVHNSFITPNVLCTYYHIPFCTHYRVLYCIHCDHIVSKTFNVS